MNNKKYKVIYIDPPWTYDDTRNNDPAEGGITYSVMSIEELSTLKIKEISDKNCALFMWVTMPLLKKGMYLIESWGFKYTTCAFCWVKLNPKGVGLYSGMGAYSNANSELCLLAKRGHPKRVARNIKQIVMAPRSRHSEKPDEVRNRIVLLMGEVPRIEIFARKKVIGWDTIGYDIDNKDVRDNLQDIIDDKYNQGSYNNPASPSKLF